MIDLEKAKLARAEQKQEAEDAAIRQLAIDTDSREQIVKDNTAAAESYRRNQQKQQAEAAAAAEEELKKILDDDF